MTREVGDVVARRLLTFTRAVPASAPMQQRVPRLLFRFNTFATSRIAPSFVLFQLFANSTDFFSSAWGGGAPVCTSCEFLICFGFALTHSKQWRTTGSSSDLNCAKVEASNKCSLVAKQCSKSGSEDVCLLWHRSWLCDPDTAVTSCMCTLP